MKTLAYLNSLIISSLRIFATIGIFTFHLLGLYNLNNYKIDFYSILIFCYLSGYLNGNPSISWYKKRILALMIPYWMVIIPILIINKIVGYKNTTILTDFITLLGGNMFLSEKVYVIAWYITFVLLLYSFLFAQSFFKNFFLNSIIWIGGFLIFTAVFHKIYYFMAFGIGFFTSHIFPPPNKTISETFNVARIFFIIQGHCYSFFLIHGGILLFLITICKMNFYNSLFIGAATSIVCAIILNTTTKFVMTTLLSEQKNNVKV